MEYIEITERTVDDAITTACQRLSVTSNRLDYIIVQKEKSGFLGIGAKPAIIKARVKDGTAQAILEDVIGKAEKKVKKDLAAKTAKTVKPAEKKEETAAAPASGTEQKAPVKPEKEAKAEKKEAEKAEKSEKKELKDKEKENKKTNKKNKKKSSASKKSEEAAEPAQAAPQSEEKAAPAPRKKAVIPQLTDEKIAEVKKAAHDFLVGVFATMDMDVEITEDYQKETGILTVNMEGDDMGVLIGKRGQTLDSLQYLVSLVVNKDVDGYIHVKADTENYRERRKKTLENLAKNIAFKVKRTRQPVALEPMNPYERRIIHSELQNEKYITTYSEGEEPYRKVVVALKKDENGENLLVEERPSKGGRGRNGKGRNGRGERRGRDFRESRDSRRGTDNAAEFDNEADHQSDAE